MRLTRKQKQKLKKTIKEWIGCGICGIGLGALVIAWLFYGDGSADAAAAQPQNQVYYGGVYWSPEDYESMMAERAEYLAAEAAAENQTQVDKSKISVLAAESSEDKIIKSLDFGADDAELLAHIAMAEAESEDTEGKALVILVVLNRVWSEGFPGTIEEVIEEPGQFAAYTNGRYDRVEPDEDSWAALELVLSGWDESEGATFFEHNDGTATWQSENLQMLFTHGAHTFYKEAEE